jgi:riboflavin synthase
MFTGLVEAVGRVVDVQTTPSGRRLTIDSALLADVREGDSVCVNGVCLTATHVGGGQMAADIGPETMRVTTLGRIDAGARVNLERAMRQDGRLGGHFVTGHVDGTGRVVAMRADGESHWVSVAFDAAFARLFISKGSVAVNGVSLTVAAVGEASFDVMLIPYTWAHTTLADLRVGDAVNLECDMLGKYVARALALAGVVQ